MIEVKSLNNKQVACLAGGHQLKLDIGSMTAEYKKANEGRKMLRKAFEGNERIAYDLLIMLAKSSTHIAETMESDDV